MKWLRQYGTSNAGRIRLLCFHYAGGTASMFRTWHTLLPDVIEPVAIQLPGRDDRHAEPPYESMSELVPDLIDALTPILDKPFACYGFSMGARVALALSYELRSRGLPLPVKLFVASSAAPALRLPVRGWDESDEGLAAYMKELGGTSAVVFDHPDLLELFLPTVRADLKVVGTCPVPEREPLTVPVRAFAGNDDREASPARMLPWGQETSAEFDLNILPGAHFFTDAGTAQMLGAVTKDLVGVSAG
ncbi:thioesterase II family protein [Kibdelosporangium aridum]|uniref:Thioesterase domain-containing protein n=1 Tax=Kibdelosporangium aridum TaxID=2030 RepID=A0A1W2BQT0_KIBAR|nr:thioesterase domain-containing protein [Kibdelosporangium aridum]SMC75300.1 Thioesterase domain-containing protein [Kibdelosporangium aridum]